jgi:type I restriction enzyme R subunit
MSHNENTRVKIPAILHLERLGYSYLSLKDAKWDIETNIFTDIFFESVAKINPSKDLDEIQKYYDKLNLILENEDLGKAFYELLLSGEIKLIDFDNFENNTFNVVTELTYKNGEDEFRPDITLLINGIPLAFIEVKKPNNKDGILAERNRINTRFSNPKFRKFINLTQILVFSNNMEYDPEGINYLQGAFYSSTSYKKAIFNSFKEDKGVETLDLDKILKPENEEIENFVLRDNNLVVIKHSPEFLTNKDPQTTTNRILTSLFSKDRLKTWLKFSIAYVKSIDGWEKHIMRYPQFFATKAIENTLNQDKRKGIVWHTQGSGKTALAFYNVRYLTNYFQNQNINPKFYFIVDRIDLLEQAKKEFTSRGLMVHTVSTKDELLVDFRSNKIIHNTQGKLEITVVNIHKFKEDTGFLNQNSYNQSIQRVYFLDEVHRSYNPNGSFLANLTTSDKKAIIIGLTGTPLIGNNLKSKDLFGDYIHKYYYNSSISDGYTLKLIREGIETNYQIRLQEILQQIRVKEGDIERRQIYAHKTFVKPMLEYIIKDFQNSRIILGDDSIGSMVVCDSSEQAKLMYELFEKEYSQNLSAKLILHDIGFKEERKDWTEDFKNGKVDILFVYNMLLTGFDAKRLKKLYLGRLIKKHNLLQTLTRVNRPYKDFRYGYVVDFADIRSEFDATNQAYFDELQQELVDEMQTYSNIFLSKEEVENEIENIKDTLFAFDTDNAEIFSQQINQINDKTELLKLKKALGTGRNLFNLIRLFGHFDLLKNLDFQKLGSLFNEVVNRINLINQKEALENQTDTTNILNTALEEVLFTFRKISEEEMVIADKLKSTLKKTREEMASNFDPKDKEFVDLYNELKRIFANKNLDEISQEEMTTNIDTLEKIYEAITDLNRRNNLLKDKYKGDQKYARIHKRILENPHLNLREIVIHESLMEIKQELDDKVLQNKNIVTNDSYFEQMTSPIVDKAFGNRKIDLDFPSLQSINQTTIKEYIQEMVF